jgi:hypothetical protein
MAMEIDFHRASPSAQQVCSAPPSGRATPTTCYCSRIGCSCPKVVVVDGTDVTGTVPRK